MISIEEQFKYISNLEDIHIYFNKEYNKINKNIYSLILYTNVNTYIYINKLPNTLIKLVYFTYNNLKNLPLNLKFLHCTISNNNLSPNIIYLNCYLGDIHNFPRSLQFIYIITKIVPKELIHYNYKINFICNFYYKIIKLKSIY